MSKWLIVLLLVVVAFKLLAPAAFDMLYAKWFTRGPEGMKAPLQISASSELLPGWTAKQLISTFVFTVVLPAIILWGLRSGGGEEEDLESFFKRLKK